jgi:hypothetical protein
VDLSGLPPILTALGALVTACGAVYAAIQARKGRKIANEVDAKIVRIGEDVYEIGRRVDGRLSELLAAEKGQARAEGVAAGEQSQRDRHPEPIA